jgi:hypothetical protein
VRQNRHLERRERAQRGDRYVRADEEDLLLEQGPARTTCLQPRATEQNVDMRAGDIQRERRDQVARGPRRFGEDWRIAARNLRSPPPADPNRRTRGIIREDGEWKFAKLKSTWAEDGGNVVECNGANSRQTNPLSNNCFEVRSIAS